jgi:hypothetical protein
VYLVEKLAAHYRERMERENVLTFHRELG